MKKTIIASAILLLSAMGLSAQEPDAVYKLVRQQWTVNADGTTDYHYRHEVQILRNRALTAYADKGETFVVYNPAIEELTVNEVYTLRADGSRVDMPPHAFVYQLPSACADCGRFNSMRELVMVHTGMEIGCTIVVDYTLRHRYTLLSRTLDLVRDCPVERLEVGVSLPDDQELSVQFSNPGYLAFDPVVEQTDHSFSLTADNVPQAFVDTYLPGKETVYPTVRFYNGIPEYKPAFTDEAYSGAASAVAAVASGTSGIARVAAIRDFVVDNVHLNDIAPDKVAYTHATPDEVWRTGCGTATDKAVLLAAVLNHEGYSAHVAGDRWDEVGVLVDSLEYRFSVRRKSPATLYGEAKDEVVTLKNEFKHDDFKADSLADGFFRLRLAPVQGVPAVSAANLALVRTAPLQSAPCDINQTDIYSLPKGVKMAGSAINEALSFDGIGSVQVSVKQSGRKVKVVRKVKLDQSLVPASDYPSYRRLVALWQKYDNLLLRSK